MTVFSFTLHSFLPESLHRYQSLITTTIIFQIIILVFLTTVRIIQRFYFFSRGHKLLPLFNYNPRDELQKLFALHKISYSENTFTTKTDDINLKYYIIGSGKMKVLLSNGVGTDLFMWYFIFKYLIQFDPTIFNEITIYAPCFRGLFGSGPTCYANKEYDTKNNYASHIVISIDKCADDIIELMEHLKITKFDTSIGWSLGVQTILTCFGKHPQKVNDLILLTPTTGLTLHSVLQPFVQWPYYYGTHISYILKNTIKAAQNIIETSFFDILQSIANSILFRLFLENLSFWGGYPPEQAPYFHAYMKDLFSNRKQLYALLELILALDSPCTKASLSLNNPALILSGFPDFLTGVYHAFSLKKTMKNSKHIMFTMASHFLLIEWPDMVAEEIGQFMKIDQNKQPQNGFAVKKTL